MPGPANRLAVAAVAALASFLIPTSAALLAQEPGEPIRLEYRAAEGCPSEADFVARIYARTGRARLAWPGESARTFAVSLSPGPPVSASVAVRDVHGRDEGTRSVQAASCGEAADVTALVVALAVDPAALASPPVASSAPSIAGAVDAGRTEDTGLALDAGAAPIAPLLPARPASSVDALSPSNAPREAERPSNGAPIGRYGFFAGADFTATSGVAPVAMLGASPYVGWRFLRLGFLRADSGVLAANGGGTADFTWTVGRLDGCPFAVHLGPVVGSACVRVEVGELEADGVSVTAGRDRSRFWFAAGPLARAEWRFFGPLFLDGEAALSFRVTQDRFYFLPETTVEQVPLLGLTGSVGVGAHFL